MNRRAFLSSGALSTAAFSVGSLARPGFLQAQSAGPNPNIYAASGSAHAIASANALYSQPSGTDWFNTGNSLSSVAADWQANGLDAQVQAACGAVNPSSVTSGNINQQQILTSIQVFQPAFTLADVQNALSYLDSQTPSDIAQVISSIQQGGMLQYINQLVSQAPRLGSAVDNEYNGSGAGPSAMNRLHRKVAPNWARIEQPPPSDTGGYSCATDGALIFAAGIAFATLTVMTMGADAVLIGGAWGAIATWGGLGTTGWGIGHALVGCSF